MSKTFDKDCPHGFFCGIHCSECAEIERQELLYEEIAMKDFERDLFTNQCQLEDEQRNL